MALFYSTGGNGYASAYGPGTLLNMEGNTFLHLFDYAELTDGLGDVFSCGIGHDTIFAGIGSDIILGGDGNDYISGGAGFDVMTGGAGIDTYDATSFTGNYVWDMGTGVTNVIGENAAGFEVAMLGDGNDLVTGSTGQDTIFGGGGDDTLRGGGGVDNVYGGDGNDLFQFFNGDMVDEIGGDRQFSTRGTDINTLDLSAITAQGAVVDLASGTWEMTPILLVPATIVSISVVYGTQLGDTLIGTTRYVTIGDTTVYNGNALYGQGGDDRITGDFANDTIYGGPGSDTIVGGDGRDFLSGDDGDDSFIVLAGQATDDTFGGSGFDTLDLSGIDSAGVTLNLASGTLTAAGLGGAVSIISIEHAIGGQLGDLITGGAATEVIEGGNGSDILRGGGGGDTLTGDAGDDTLSGGGGADVLEGGTFGFDRFSGGGGADIFVFYTRSGADVIRDFQDGSDRINLSDYALDPAEVLAMAAQVRGGVLFTLDAVDSILIKGLTIAQLDGSDFIL